MSGKNVAHSVRTRLLDRSRKSGEDYQLLLNRYAIERLLYRLARSDHGKAFVLKGAMLFALWTGEMHRPTRDLDLLGFGDPSQERLRDVFRSLCAVPVDDDGLIFDADSVTVEPIREDQEYGGQRAKFIVRLGQAKISLQVDVGFGDAITPAAEEVEYPTLLGMDPPRLRAYPKETVVAEKVEAMVKLGLANSRMKDFYDVLVMSRTFEFDGAKLRSAISATFARRGTELPTEMPLALTTEFAADDQKRKQWDAFKKRSGLEGRMGELSAVTRELTEFFTPVLALARENGFMASWIPGRKWVS
jgi:predicted nucleotidyltransferase component of viral defense system